MFPNLMGTLVVRLLMIWTSLLTTVCQILLFLSFLLTTAFALGWTDRLVWYLVEQEASKILNGTAVTLGRLQIDWLRGRIHFSNVIIHAPTKGNIKWESPVLARLGTIHLHVVNLVPSLLAKWFLGEEWPLDIVTVHMQDLQVFVERKYDLYNFFLLDPHVVLPENIELEQSNSEHENHVDDAADSCNTTTLRDTNTRHTASTEDTEEETTAPQQAEKLVQDMVRALGRATKKGTSWQDALAEQRSHLTDQLRAFRSHQKKDALLQQGVEMVQHVSHAVALKTKDTQHVVLPDKRPRLPGEKVVTGRVGRILLQEVRVFTRDFESSSEAMCWSRPLVLHQVSVRASELCPPLAAKDHENGECLPTVYQPVDQILEAVWKRILAEATKSSSGRLFQAAMGEVLVYWMEKSKSHQAAAVHSTTHSTTHAGD